MWDDFKNWLHRRRQWMEANFWECVSALFIFGIVDAYVLGIFIDNTEISLVEWIASLVTISGLFLLVRRTQNQSKQINDQMFNSAVALLGSGETSARTGGIYSLYHLALNNEKYRGQVAQILCSHIRSKTQEKEYQEEHKEKPSNEIQTTIDLLFRDTPSQKGLYCEFDSNLPRADLSNAYLVGAYFINAHCVGADFKRARCERVEFGEACLQRAYFNKAHCEGAEFSWSHCEGTFFLWTHCEGAHFNWTHCEGARFMGAYCERADFSCSHCEGTYFGGAHCEGAYFSWAFCQGSHFRKAYCTGADFRKARCEGIDFEHAYCEGADFTEAHCQGGAFEGAHCQGAFADSDIEEQKLADRIEKNTDLKDMIISGELDEESVHNIESVKGKNFLPEIWHSKMQKIIDQNKGKDLLSDAPKGISDGTLHGTEKLLALIKKFEEIEMKYGERRRVD